MDQTLRCNSLPCRKLLYTQGKAVSTTCSHIFCHDCAVTLFRGRRACPACETQLESPDDCIMTNLNPSSSYKASILAGLTPSVIMEICTRAIGFYQYQASQEAAFQQVILNKSQDMLERYALENENIERRAETEMSLLQQKMKVLQDDLNGEKTKNQELRQGMQTLRRDYEKLRGQLDAARRKAIGNDGINPNVYQHPTEMGPSSTTSVPQPFYAGRSMNSPFPFLPKSTTDLKQQTNLWHNQMQSHLRQSPPLPQKCVPIPVQRDNQAFPRRSTTPMMPASSRLDGGTALFRGQSVSSHSRNGAFPITNNRNVNTPIRAMPSPGFPSPRHNQTNAQVDKQGRNNLSLRLQD